MLVDIRQYLGKDGELPVYKMLSRANKLQNEDLAFHATAGFSIKEAFFKFQYPITRQWLGFKDVEVVVSSDKISLEIVSKAKIKNILPEYDCFFYSSNNLVVTGVFACR